MADLSLAITLANSSPTEPGWVMPSATVNATICINLAARLVAWNI